METIAMVPHFSWDQKCNTERNPHQPAKHRRRPVVFKRPQTVIPLLIRPTFPTCQRFVSCPLHRERLESSVFTATSLTKPLDRLPLPSWLSHPHRELQSAPPPPLLFALKVCRKPVENTQEIITNVSNPERDQSSAADKKHSY